jgi:TonB-dependent receptor
MSFKKYLSLFGLLAFMAPLVIAQEEAEDEDVEEVVVTGIKKSLLDAIDIKRNNTGIVDAITAEDFGKFPDNNLAESLARVVGVGIDRSNVEGAAIAVRGFGPQYNLVTLNGRQMPTAPTYWYDGRSFNFGDISSHGIAAVEIYKSINSTLPSGGIGSTVNIVTTKPLLIDGSLTSVSADYLLDSTNPEDELQPEVNFVHTNNFGRWAYSISGSFQDRTNREIGTRESNWLTYPDVNGILGYDLYGSVSTDNITNNNKRADGKVFWQEPTAYQFKDNERERTNAQAALQFEVTENLVATIDYTYSNVDFSSTGQMFGSWLGGWNTIGGTINERGVATDIVVSNRGYDHQYIYGATENENTSTGFNLEYVFSDALVLELDYHDSSSERTGTELPNEIGLGAPAKAVVTHTNARSGIHYFDYDQYFAADEYSLAGVIVRDQYKNNDIEQVQLKGVWENLDGAFLSSYITSIEFGVSLVDSVYTDNRAEEFPTANALADKSVPASLMVAKGLDGFFDGFSWNSGAAVDYYYEIQPGIVDFAASLLSLDPGSWDTIDTIEEEMESAWVQVNMEFSVNDRPLNVVLGVRNEKTDRTSTGLQRDPTALVWAIQSIEYDYAPDYLPSSRTGTDEILLPSLSAAYEFADDKVLRFSYSESMARPSLQNLRSALAYGSQGYTQPVVNGGNPDMKALTAENLDLAFEWYYEEGSYFALNWFRKEIDNFPDAGQFAIGNIGGLTNPALGPRAAEARACVAAWRAAGSPVGPWGADSPWGGPAIYTLGDCVNDRLISVQSWMGDNELAAVAAANYNAWVNNDPILGETWWWDGMWNMPFDNPYETGISCYAGYWYCDHANLRGNADDPLAEFLLNTTVNKRAGRVNGFEIVWQHLFGDTGYGFQFNATLIDGGDTDINKYEIGRQFLLNGLGDSGNFSVFYEDDQITARVALNNRGETVAGFGAYDQPLYVEERNQIDASFAYRINEQASVFLEFQNLNDETTRLHARHKEMLFLSQDHGVISRVGFRYKF